VLGYNGRNMTYPTPAQGRQPTIGVTFLAWLNIYQGLKQAIQDVIAPEMQKLNGNITALSAEIGALRQRMDTFEKYVDQRFEGLERSNEERFKAVNQRFDYVDQQFKNLDKRIDILEHYWNQSLDIRERLETLEGRLKGR